MASRLITVATVRNEDFDSQPLPKVELLELLSQHKLSGMHALPPLKGFRRSLQPNTVDHSDLFTA